jgi:hypothetical protein
MKEGTSTSIQDMSINNEPAVLIEHSEENTNGKSRGG